VKRLLQLGMKMYDYYIKLIFFTFHTNPNSTLCLGTEAAIYTALSENCSLIEFIEQILIRYLFAFSLWEKAKILPFGERSHGPMGIMEFHSDFFKVDNFERVQNLLHSARFSDNVTFPFKLSYDYADVNFF
jgi:hypothetical protein